jgi:hypothetical protein
MSKGTARFLRSPGKIKALMRAAKAGTREEFEQSFDAALHLITKADCPGWFAHCGYEVTPNCK